MGRYTTTLGTSLAPLTNLTSLSLNSMKEPLGNSFATLTHLRSLALEWYRQPLGDSLDTLPQLEQFKICSGYYSRFRIPGSRVSGLTQLRSLEIKAYVDDESCFSTLTKLTRLHSWGEVHMGKSLSYLTGLTDLTLHSRVEDDDLSSLTNLERLNLPILGQYNKLELILGPLPKLRVLKIPYYSGPIDHVIAKLTTLEELVLPCNYDKEVVCKTLWKILKPHPKKVRWCHRQGEAYKCPHCTTD